MRKKQAVQALVPHKRVNPFKEIWRNKFLYLLVLPAALYTFVYCYCSLPYLAIALRTTATRPAL